VSCKGQSGSGVLHGRPAGPVVGAAAEERDSFAGDFHLTLEIKHFFWCEPGAQKVRCGQHILNAKP
jgi:hypothetical protein